MELNKAFLPFSSLQASSRGDKNPYPFLELHLITDDKTYYSNSLL